MRTLGGPRLTGYAKAAGCPNSSEHSFSPQFQVAQPAFGSAASDMAPPIAKSIRYDHGKVKDQHWLTWYPILEAVLPHLSASESALLLSILGLLHKSCLVRRFVTPIRDLPEYETWVNLMISKGHTVFLLGGDIIDLRLRLEKPQRYWKQGKGGKALRIWLVARTSKTAAHALKEQGRAYWLTSNGDLLYPKTRDEVRAIEISKNAQRNGQFIPVPGTKCSLKSSDSSHHSGRSNWQTSNIQNNSNIDIVCADLGTENYGFSNQITDARMTPRFELCPVKYEHRKNNYVMVHGSGTERQDCHILSPGSLNKPSHKGYSGISSGFTLPYFDVRKGAYLFTKHLVNEMDSRLVRDERDELDSVAIELEFKCRGAKSAIHENTQAVLW